MRAGTSKRTRHIAFATAAVLVALLLVVGSCGAGSSRRRSTGYTFDASSLGVSGGAFCDEFRVHLRSTVAVAGQVGATSNDSDRRTAVRDFFVLAERSTKKLEELAPTDLRPYFRVQHAGNVFLLNALKKVDFDLRRLDAGTLETLADLDPTTTGKSVDFDRYVRKTCGIDLIAFSNSIRPLSGVTPPAGR